MAFSSRADLQQGTAAQEALNTIAHSSSISNSAYIGQPAPQTSTDAQCKRPAQYSPTGRGYFYWYWPPQLAASFISSSRMMSPIGTFRKCRDVRVESVMRTILLHKSKVVSVRIFGETLKREAIDDSDNLSRATEVAYEFCVRR